MSACTRSSRRREEVSPRNSLFCTFDDSSHKDLPLKEGTRCEDGSGCGECSHNVFPTFAMERKATSRRTPSWR